MQFEELARKCFAVESSDKNAFQRRARVLQSLWRIEQGYDCGEQGKGERARQLGSRLRMPWAQEALANFLTEQVKAVVRAEVLDKKKSRGKLYGKPRFFNDLLSSQPLCFNLFAALRFDLGLASRLVAHFTKQRVTEVVAVEFEFSPSRGDLRYSGDRSAFDVFLECRAASGARAFLGIEVKYHEDLRSAPAEHRERHGEIADLMGCFLPEARGKLKCSPLEQLWRDHLLSGIVRVTEGYEDAIFVVLHPAANDRCCKAVEAYRQALSDSRSFDAWLLEDVLDFLIASTDAEWPRLAFDRYCDFSKLENPVV